MTEITRFYSRTRMSEARMLMRRTQDFTSGNAALEIVTALFEDISADLASHAEGQEEAAFALIMRCMGNVARENARDAYDRAGFPNPFVGGGQPALDTPAPEPLWKWPVIVQSPPGGATDGNMIAGFQSYSALKMFGYTVGKTKGWATAARAAFLSDLMEQELPPIVGRIFGDEYGKPMSTVRLRKMANVIASAASNSFKRDQVRYAQAIADWKHDLAFLKHKYYDGAGLAFQPWPKMP